MIDLKSLFPLLALSLFLSCCGGGSSAHEMQDSIDSALSTFRQEGSGSPELEIPGAVVAVGNQRATKTAISQGKANLEAGEIMRSDMPFHIGSISKTFTAAWILQLNQEGQLSLEDKISKFFEFPLGDEITVRELLSHTSGIVSFTAIPEFLSFYDANPYPDPEDILNFMRAHPKQSFAPGEGYEYSNSNFYLLGLIGQEVTGRTWASEIRARFLDKYDLRSTYIYGAEQGPASPQGYTICPASGCGVPTLVAYGSDADYKLGWAAGSVVSTAEDIAKWMALLVSGPVLDAEHRQEMLTLTPQSVAYEKSQGEEHYSLVKGAGLCLFEYYAQNGGYGWGHSGQIGGFGNVVVYFPDEGQSVSLVTNLINSDVDHGVRDIANAAF